jgi:hypothetical protein
MLGHCDSRPAGSWQRLRGGRGSRRARRSAASQDRRRGEPGNGFLAVDLSLLAQPDAQQRNDAQLAVSDLFQQRGSPLGGVAQRFDADVSAVMTTTLSDQARECRFFGTCGWSRRWSTVTVTAKRVRKSASSIALSPPIAAMRLSLKSAPSQLAQQDRPWPVEGSSRHPPACRLRGAAARLVRSGRLLGRVASRVKVLDPWREAGQASQRTRCSVLLASRIERNLESITAKCPRRHQKLGEIWEMIKRFWLTETNQDQRRLKL